MAKPKKSRAKKASAKNLKAKKTVANAQPATDQLAKAKPKAKAKKSQAKKVKAKDASPPADELALAPDAQPADELALDPDAPDYGSVKPPPWGERTTTWKEPNQQATAPPGLGPQLLEAIRTGNYSAALHAASTGPRFSDRGYTLWLLECQERGEKIPEPWFTVTPTEGLLLLLYRLHTHAVQSRQLSEADGKPEGPAVNALRRETKSLEQALLLGDMGTALLAMAEAIRVETIVLYGDYTVEGKRRRRVGATDAAKAIREENQKTVMDAYEKLVEANPAAKTYSDRYWTKSRVMQELHEKTGLSITTIKGIIPKRGDKNGRAEP